VFTRIEANTPAAVTQRFDCANLAALNLPAVAHEATHDRLDIPEGVQDRRVVSEEDADLVAGVHLGLQREDLLSTEPLEAVAEALAHLPSAGVLCEGFLVRVEVQVSAPNAKLRRSHFLRERQVFLDGARVQRRELFGCGRNAFGAGGGDELRQPRNRFREIAERQVERALGVEQHRGDRGKHARHRHGHDRTFADRTRVSEAASAAGLVAIDQRDFETPLAQHMRDTGTDDAGSDNRDRRPCCPAVGARPLSRACRRRCDHLS
jgi:hypothetical protein